MEVRHPTAQWFVRPARRRGHRPLRQRLLAWIFSWRFDAALAAGADPHSDPLLACRAAQLVSPGARHRIADGLRDAVESAALPRVTSAAAPLAAASVRANSGLLLALAARLDAELPIDARGAAKAEHLLTDAGSTLCEPGTALGLEGEVEAALIALGT